MFVNYDSPLPKHPRATFAVQVAITLVILAETILAMFAAVGIIASIVTMYGVSMWWFSALFPAWLAIFFIAVHAGKAMEGFRI